MELQYSENPSKNVFNIQLRKEGPKYRIRSDFDGGNIGKVENGGNSSIVLSPANDCSGTEHESHAKGWFHFGITGHQVGSKIKFIMKRMNQLGCSGRFLDYFKPVYRYQDGPWERVEQAIVFNKEDDVELHFQIKFEKTVETFFAYSYPFSFTECENFIAELKSTTKTMKNIYFHDEMLIKSVQSRPLHLLTISSFDRRLTYRESPINDYLFTEDKCRAFKFENSKKVILISARVHPGESPSSHTMNGVLKFLLSKDVRAQLLRKNFVFKIVPMLNPDGVFNGHYRMDTLNQNLNRFYLNPDPFRQPSAFALRKLGEYYQSEDRLCFYIDLHAHPQKKGNFIYGNAMDDQQKQIETQLFPKILAMNCIQFDYENSSFSKNHMNLKDRNQDLTKQGCGRVVFHRNLSQIYSYTMQCGYTASSTFNELSALSNPHRKVEKLGIVQDDLDSLKSNYYSSGKQLYLTIRSYENLGRCILISILDIFKFNPFSRIPNSIFKNLDGIRKLIGQQIVRSKLGNRTPIGINPRKFERQKNNQSFAMVGGRSIPKSGVITPIFEKQTVSSKVIERLTKKRQKSRGRTLPKML